MIEGKVGSEGVALGVGTGPDRLELDYHDRRIQLLGASGYAKRIVFENSRVYYGAGGKVVGAINTERSHAMPTTNHARHADKITLTEGAALAEEVHRKTNGTSKLDDVALFSAFDTIGNYPALVANGDGGKLAGFQAKFGHMKRGYEESRAIAYAIYDDNGVLAKYPEFRRLLGESFTSRGLETLTLGDVRLKTANFLTAVRKFDNDTQIITGPRDAALAKINDWLTAQSMPVNLSKEQQETLLDHLRKIPRELEAFQDKLSDTVSPEEIRKFYETTTRIVRYDPVLEVTGYVAAAHELPLGKASLVTGAVLEQGIRINSDTIYAKRNEQGRSQLHIDKASIQSQLVFAGMGTNAFNAMPTDAAYKMGVEPASGFGGHVFAQQNKTKFLSDEVRSRAAGVAFKFSESSGSNGLTYLEVGASHEKRPGEIPSTKWRATFGKIF